MRISLLDTFERVENPAGLKTKLLKEISWKKLHSQVERKYSELPGGSYCFCVDDEKNVYLIEWEPTGNKESTLILKIGRLER
jgi:hypothetical protein